MRGLRTPVRSVIAALVAAMLASAFGCAKKPAQVVQAPGHFTVDFVDAGTEALAPSEYTVDPNLSGEGLAEYAVTQLLAGPSTGRDTVVLFPAGTTINVTLNGDMAVADLGGPLVKSYTGGAEDEAAMFKSLVYTLTNVSGVNRVQVLLGGKKRAALPGGHMELDEPLTRGTFAQ
ncbi:MAG: GerMN domain-containing protein [Candidatus Eremiobacteraeota bacterium]|nr:GerMN domain-containing protein [Candidatus Eremiobacteraeota bacterium]